MNDASVTFLQTVRTRAIHCCYWLNEIRVSKFPTNVQRVHARPSRMHLMGIGRGTTAFDAGAKIVIAILSITISETNKTADKF